MNKITVTIIMLFSFSVFAQKDIDGSKDHPLIPRYPGSVIVFYNEVESGIYKFTLGPLVRASVDSVSLSDTKNIDGKITRIQYLINDEDGFSKAVEYFETFLRTNEFEITAFAKSNTPMNVAGRNWTLAVYNDLSYKEKSNIAGNKGGTENRYYIAGHITKENQQVYLAMIINEFDKGEVYVQADIIGPDLNHDISTEQGITSAETITKNIAENGYSIINGIYFEQGKAKLKEASGSALGEIAKYMKDNLGVTLYVVGHTAMVSNLDFQIALSKSMADAVIEILTSRYFISSERLIPQGVGPLSPITSNQKPEGREKNQRIELVLKIF
jgi:outer membrane protein OmpA-like peptidoglycan-associated protein